MDLKCKFAYNSSLTEPEKVYVCYVKSASITSFDNRTIRSICGVHKDGNGDNDVKAIYFHGTVVEFFPLGLQEIFPNLIGVLVENCGLKEITRNDLKDLRKLESLYLGFNQLTTLPSNLFEDKPELKRISLNFNKLKFVRSKLLEPLKDNKLILVNFCDNKNIDYQCRTNAASSLSAEALENLMEIIEENCQAPEAEIEEEIGKEAHKAVIMRQFEMYWTYGKFTDFSFFVDSEEIKAHKFILSINSTVFSKRFKTQPEKPNEIRIQNLSAKHVYDFLNCLYTGEYPKTENALEVFALASKFGVERLKEICERIIYSQDLRDFRAFYAFIVGHEFACEKLKVFAFNEIKKMFPGSNLPDNLMQQPENVKKLIHYKTGFDAMLKSFEEM